MIAHRFPLPFLRLPPWAAIGSRSLVSLVAFSAAVSISLFALAACGGSEDPPDPDVRIAERDYTFEVGNDALLGSPIGQLEGSVNGNPSTVLFRMVGTPEPNPDPYPFRLASGGTILVAVSLTEGTYTFQAQAESSSGKSRSRAVRVTIQVAETYISFSPDQKFSIPENAEADTVVGTIEASAPFDNTVFFVEAEPLSDAFDVSREGEIIFADGITLDFETQYMYVVRVRAVAARAQDDFYDAHISILEVQDGTEKYPWEVDTLAQLERIATGFSNPYIENNCSSIDDCTEGGDSTINKLSPEVSLEAHYRQTADIDASPSASSDYNSGAGFQPIGGTFGGSYDGAGYLISGLFIDRSSSDNVGFFSQTSSGSVLENVALVGVNVSGRNNTGVLVGYAEGAVRGSFTSGRLSSPVGGSTGGLIGRSDGWLEGSFTAVTTAASYLSGGLVGYASGTVLRSFALGSVDVSGNGAGGLVGSAAGTLSHSFATGDVIGPNAAGLAGSVSGSVSDSYAVGSASGGGLLGQGTASRSYRVSGADADTDATKITLDGLRALACDGTTEFRWDADDDSSTSAVACAPFNKNIFPWDFGSPNELPVINGLVGGLDAEGQRLAVEFSLVTGAEREAVGEIAVGENSVEVTLTAPDVERETDSILSYFWVLERSTDISATDLRSRVLTVTAMAASPDSDPYDLHLTIVERDAAGTLLAVYADEFFLTVN